MKNKYNLYEVQKKIPYEIVMPILAAWDEQSDRDITDLAKMAYDAGRNSISKEKNRMAEVAALFGKKLGEEFFVELKDEYSVRQSGKRIWKMKLEADGLRCYIPNKGWFFNRPILSDLITGTAVIVDE